MELKYNKGEKTMFKLTIRTDNEAFQDGQDVFEIARILRRTADFVEKGYTNKPLFDLNGNTIGKITYTKGR